MSKKIVIFVSILMIIAAGVIHFSVEGNPNLDFKMSGFVAGFLFGAGITLLLKELFLKKFIE
jgi:hypothetical protein